MTHRLAARVLRKAGLLEHVNLRVRVPIAGTSFLVPLNGNAGYYNLRPSEPWLLRALTAIVGWKPGAFLDVGVNVGQTLLMYAAAGGTGPYYGFDPNAAAAAYVNELIRVNGLEWARVVPVGLSDQTGCARLHLSSNVDGAASLVNGFRPDSSYKRTEVVVIFRGDDMVKALQPGPISIVKIDVEGGELDVLRGLEATLRAHRPMVFCEILPVYETRSESGRTRRSRTDALEALLQRNDYRIVRLLRDYGTQELDAVETHADPTLCEYLFHPAEARETVATRLEAHRAGA